MTVTRRYARGGTAGAVTWIKDTTFKLPGVSGPTAKVILLILADYLNHEWMGYPGQRRLAEEADVGERTVRRFLTEAEETGLLCVKPQMLPSGRGRAVDCIYLHVGGDRSQCPCHDQPAKMAASSDGPTGQMSTTNRPDETRNGGSTPHPVLEPQKNPGARANGANGHDVDALFEEWWKHYPKKDDKGAARTAFKTAIKRCPFDALVAAADAYRDDPRRDPAFTKNGSTWLRAESWANGPPEESRGPDEIAPSQLDGNDWMDRSVPMSELL